MFVLVLVYLIILTYSRSAYLGLIFGMIIGVVSSCYILVQKLFGKHPVRERWKRGVSYMWRKFRGLIVVTLIASTLV